MSDDASLTLYVDPEQLKTDVQITTATMDDDMRQHAGLYVHYATQAVRARRQYDRWKAAFEILEAELDAHYREALAEAGGKVTEGLIRAKIVQDPKWKACSSRVIEAQHGFRMAEVAERGFEQRKDMLLQLARDAARQQDGPLRAIAPISRESILEALKKDKQVS